MNREYLPPGFGRVLLLACLAGPGCSPNGGSGADGTIDAGPEEPSRWVLSLDVHVNHFGWRPRDSKTAVLRGHGGEPVEVRSVEDESVVLRLRASELSFDEDSGDDVAQVDLSALSTPGDYFVALPESGLRSYTFRVHEQVFDAVGVAAARSYYFQRCNHARVLPYATASVEHHEQTGAAWLDASCHAADAEAPAGPGSADHGPLDLRGGWHDAGDYQKTLWARGVSDLLFAYEMNPSVWSDGQLRIPESGNGIPDLLDEIAWELDFYLRMQRADGHFLTSVKGARDGTTIMSPPSASDERRAYFDGTSPDGAEWSGGGVTTSEASARAVLALAHAAIVYAAVDAERAARYREAALRGWSWVADQTGERDVERRLRAAAASAILRMEPALDSARTVVTGFPWRTLDGQRGLGATPAESVLTIGIWHHLASSSRDPALESAMRDAIAEVVVRGAFLQSGPYGGMFGAPGNPWDWSWGSNRAQSTYGANLMMAVRFGVLDGRAEDEVVERAARHLHFMLGLNPLSMVYLTNMAPYGGEHSSFRTYHGWFSHTGSDGEDGNELYDGLPEGVVDPLYPYHPDDDGTSRFGPPPGLVPGGPNASYSGQYDIPYRDRPSYAYRDMSIGCDWDGTTCRAASWELTEASLSYQGAFVWLVSFFMSR